MLLLVWHVINLVSPIYHTLISDELSNNFSIFFLCRLLQVVFSDLLLITRIPENTQTGTGGHSPFGEIAALTVLLDNQLFLYTSDHKSVDFNTCLIITIPA